LVNLSEENVKLQMQVCELKQGKNKAMEQVIELSNRCYELERASRTQESSLDQFSAVSVERDEEERPRMSLFGRKDSNLLFENCEELHSESEGE
jgi:hypothetical protein